jgi:hypothetical protein
MVRLCPYDLQVKPYLSGVLGFTDSNSDQLGTHVGKEGENEGYVHIESESVPVM